MNGLTQVELLHMEGRVERWIRFGRPVREEVLDRHRRVLWFAPGAVFAFVRWASNQHGTVVSRIDILRACGPCEAYTTVPGVTPGGESFLRLSGWPLVERALQAIDQVESLGINPADACPDHWQHVHNRVSANSVPRRYTAERHRAWHLRRETAPC